MIILRGLAYVYRPCVSCQAPFWRQWSRLRICNECHHEDTWVRWTVSSNTHNIPTVTMGATL